MTKAELLKKLAKETGETQTVVDNVIAALTELVKSEVRDNGNDITLPGLGTFKQKSNEARVALNPLTGKKIDVSASKTVVFKVSSGVKVKL